MVSEAQKSARDKWDKKNKVQISLKLYRGRDDDVIDHILDMGTGRTKYIADLIREDMRRREDG